VLVDGAPLPGSDGQGGHGPGIKTGAGGKPQGYAPSACDWHRGKVPGFEQVHGAPQPGDVATDGKHVGIV